jgi:hypothetical protein
MTYWRPAARGMSAAWRRRRLLALPLAVLCVVSGAHAQEADHTDRGDVEDFREHEDGLPEPYEVGADGMPSPSWSLEASAPLLRDTNPFWARDGSSDALLAAPSATLAYSHPRVFPGWDLELSARASADVFSHDPEELNEARLYAAATLFHRIGNAGALSFTVRARWSYIGKSFGDFDQAQQRYIVMFVPTLSDNVWASVSAEYRDSSRASERRMIGTASFDWTMLDSEEVRLGFFQEFAFSTFTEGANEGRNDLLSLSELLLTPKLGLPTGMRLGVAATLFHRFSNREASRFTAIQVGPSLRFSF